MGMAASQARYLGLAARKTNCEYQGQQINQARTALANQSAELWNQMLGLSVPTVPDQTNYTQTQYSFSDDPKKLGAPSGFTITVRNLKVSAGAGFIVALTGDIMTMPGLPKEPLAKKIDLDENGEIINIS